MKGGNVEFVRETKFGVFTLSPRALGQDQLTNVNVASAAILVGLSKLSNRTTLRQTFLLMTFIVLLLASVYSYCMPSQSYPS
jgi:hypothetical protein